MHSYWHLYFSTSDPGAQIVKGETTTFNVKSNAYILHSSFIGLKSSPIYVEGVGLNLLIEFSLFSQCYSSLRGGALNLNLDGISKCVVTRVCFDRCDAGSRGYACYISFPSSSGLSGSSLFEDCFINKLGSDTSGTSDSFYCLYHNIDFECTNTTGSVTTIVSFSLFRGSLAKLSFSMFTNWTGCCLMNIESSTATIVSCFFGDYNLIESSSFRGSIYSCSSEVSVSLSVFEHSEHIMLKTTSNGIISCIMCEGSPQMVGDSITFHLGESLSFTHIHNIDNACIATNFDDILRPKNNYIPMLYIILIIFE